MKRLIDAVCPKIITEVCKFLTLSFLYFYSNFTTGLDTNAPQTAKGIPSNPGRLLHYTLYDTGYRSLDCLVTCNFRQTVVAESKKRKNEKVKMRWSLMGIKSLSCRWQSNEEQVNQVTYFFSGNCSFLCLSTRLSLSFLQKPPHIFWQGKI